MGIREAYDQQNKKKILVILFSFMAMILISIYTVTLGEANISIGEVFSSLRKTFTGDSLNVKEKIIFHLRLPRVFLAILAGAGLSLSGVVMQGITGNPLVSPFTIGISSAAAFGASLAMVFGVGILTDTRFGVVLTAFLFALICAFLVYSIALKVGLTPETLILTGIALNYLFSAFTATIQFFSQEYQLASVVNWTFGSFNGAKWEYVNIILFVVILALPLLYKMSWVFNVMSANDDDIVRGLGINPVRARGIAGILSVLITSAIISFTGVIGFVGLVAPHISRLIIGSDHRYLIPFSAVAGALLLIVSDTIGRMVFSPVMVPVGIIVSYLGVPLFINLIINRKKGHFK